MDAGVNSEPSGFVIALILTLVFGGALTLIGVAATLLTRRARHMSSGQQTARADHTIVRTVDQHPPIVKQPIATTSNAGNAELPVNAIVPEEAREIIRFQAKVEALAALIRDGQVTNMAKGIERAFGCARSSKEDSVYQRARRALDPLVNPKPQFPPRTPEQEAFARQLHQN